MSNTRTLIVDRFALIIASLCYSVVERTAHATVGAEGAEPLTDLVRGAMWDRMAGLGRRLALLVTRLQAGKLRIFVRRRFFRAGTARMSPARAPAVAGARLPRGFGWFLRLSPDAHEAVAHMRLLLRDPEMAALVGTHPAFGRVMRPLCHMLAIAPQPDMVALKPLPSRPRKPRPPRPRPVLTPEQVLREEMFSRTTAFGPPGSRRRSRVRLE